MPKTWELRAAVDKATYVCCFPEAYTYPLEVSIYVSVRFKADLKFKENEIANRVPVSETQKQFEAARQAEERQKKYYESQGLRAEDNAKFRQDQLKRQNVMLLKLKGEQE